MLIEPSQHLAQLTASVLLLQASENFENGDAGERENTVLLGVPVAASDDISVMPP